MPPAPFWVNRLSCLPPSDVAVTLNDIISPNQTWTKLVLCNFMIDLEWMITAAPAIKDAHAIQILCGESSDKHILDAAQRNQILTKTIVFRPPLPLPYGTHHTKMILCFSREGVRVVVTTANFLCDDWERKSQGIYCQDFPPCDQLHQTSTVAPNHNGDDFQATLDQYFRLCGAPLEELSQYSFTSAQVRLIPSVPGVHLHNRAEMFGQGRLRKVLRERKPSASKHLSWQYSSQGSLNASFLADLQQSMLGQDAAASIRPQVRIHYPTEGQVRESLEGWRGGSSIPVTLKNWHEFANSRLYRWGLSSSAHPRKHAMPHIKSYSRHDGHFLDWFLLTSANLSRAALGEFQKGGTQLQIRSYEMGVLYLPEMLDRIAFSIPSAPIKPPKSCPALCFHSFNGNRHCIFLPYDILHPVPYQSTRELLLGSTTVSARDTPWLVDAPHQGCDCFGDAIDVLGSYSHYGPECWAANTRDFRSWQPSPSNAIEVIDVDAESDGGETKRKRLREVE